MSIKIGTFSVMLTSCGTGTENKRQHGPTCVDKLHVSELPRTALSPSQTKWHNEGNMITWCYQIKVSSLSAMGFPQHSMLPVRGTLTGGFLAVLHWPAPESICSHRWKGPPRWAPDPSRRWSWPRTSDWAWWSTWCRHCEAPPLPAEHTITRVNRNVPPQQQTALVWESTHCTL